LKEKENYYEDDAFSAIERKKLKEVIKEKYLLKKIYYDLDGKSIFKRVHRFEIHIFIKICFIYITLFNIIDFITNIHQLVVKKNYFNEKGWIRAFSLYLNMINILCILFITTYTVVKREIQTSFYY